MLPAENAESEQEAVEVAIDLSSEQVVEEGGKEPKEEKELIKEQNSAPRTEKSVLAAAPVEEKFVGNG